MFYNRYSSLFSMAMQAMELTSIIESLLLKFLDEKGLKEKALEYLGREKRKNPGRIISFLEEIILPA